MRSLTLWISKEARLPAVSPWIPPRKSSWSSAINQRRDLSSTWSVHLDWWRIKPCVLRRLASIGLWNWPGRTQHATRSLLAGKPKQTKPTSGTERRAEVTRANILSRVERRNQKLATRVQALDKPRAPGPQGQWEKDSETETRTKLVQMCEFGIHSLLVKAVKLLSSSKLTSRCGHEVRLDQSARLDWAESWLILVVEQRVVKNSEWNHHITQKDKNKEESSRTIQSQLRRGIPILTVPICSTCSVSQIFYQFSRIPRAGERPLPCKSPTHHGSIG